MKNVCQNFSYVQSSKNAEFDLVNWWFYVTFIDISVIYEEEMLNFTWFNMLIYHIV